ncbi:MAG: aspartate kinase [Candidatus Zixiibacteriota bacterium]|nr:MAG: aspartate kinase [candidate division Zixibacteria bacterium]
MTVSPIIVLKYGGSSVANTEQLRAVARQVIRTKAQGEDPVVVVSAMGDTTDRFLKMVCEITDRPRARELDMLLSVGERISIALLALAINAEGPYEAVSLTGSQVGIITDTNHTQAKILEVRCARIHQVLQKGQIPIVAGFQGVSVEKEITTLGRGGSDTTAVALAAALGAVQCRVMKDVEGVYTADPRQVPQAHVIDRLDYDQMLEFAATGSKVLAADAVALARQHNVEIAVGLAATGAVGSIITSGDFTGGGVRGLVALRRLSALRLHRPADLARVLADLYQEGVQIRGLHSEVHRPVLLIDEIRPPLEDLITQAEWGARLRRYRRPFARVSAIGSHLDPGGKHFARLLALLEEHGARPLWFCCSPSRVSFCVPDGDVQKLLGRLHQGLIERASRN